MDSYRYRQHSSFESCGNLIKIKCRSIFSFADLVIFLYMLINNLSYVWFHKQLHNHKINYKFNLNVSTWKH